MSLLSTNQPRLIFETVSKVIRHVWVRDNSKGLYGTTRTFKIIIDDIKDPTVLVFSRVQGDLLDKLLTSNEFNEKMNLLYKSVPSENRNHPGFSKNTLIIFEPK